MPLINIFATAEWICKTCKYKNTPACGVPCTELEYRLARLIQKTYSFQSIQDAIEFIISYL